MIGYPAARRYAELVERMTGDNEIVPPGLILEIDRPEYSALKNEIQIISWRTRAALAANFSAVGVSPNLSTRLCVIKKIIIINQTAGVLIYRVGMITNPVADAASAMASRDLRRLVQTSTIFDRVQVAQQLPSVQGIPVPANDSREINIDWILGPFGSTGVTAVIVEGDVVNQVVRAGFVGYERALLPEERVLD